MDGTIVNTGTMIAKTINYVRDNMGLKPMEEKLLLKSLNDPQINAPSFFYGSEYFTDKQTQLFEQYYHKNCIVGVELYDGMEEFLQEYSKTNTLTIATNAHSDFAKKILSHLGVDKYFEMIVGADMVKIPKPHPEMLEKTMQKLGFTKNNSMFIGDSDKDKLSAISAGINYKLVNWGFTQHISDALENVEELKTFIDK